MFYRYYSLFFAKTIVFASCCLSHSYCAEMSSTVTESLLAADRSLITNSRYLKSIDVTQLQLSNGMVCCLKSTDFETDEVFFKLAALGGYASLKPEELASGQLAEEIAWESGMGGMTSDQVSLFLYENSLEFVPEIFPFSRTIQGEGQEQSIEAFLQCIKMLFTSQQFTQEGLKAAKIVSKETISKLKNDSDRSYEAAFLRVNTQNFPGLKPMAVEDLDKVDFDKAKDFFRRCFSDPADFVCVITGNFDVAKVSQLIEQYLAFIPKPMVGSGLKKSFSVPFPPGITETTIQLINQTSCLTHVTFPLQVKVNDLNIHEIAFMCQIIEARLRQVITEKMNLSYGVDVSYEFPVYPLLDNPWISIRYRCEQNIIGSLKDIVITELKRLQSQGVTAVEVEIIKKLEENSQEFWLKDDFYWVSMLTNYYLWEWNPEKIDYKNSSIQNLSVDAINKILKQAISLSNYSVVTAVSEKK